MPRTRARGVGRLIERRGIDITNDLVRNGLRDQVILQTLRNRYGAFPSGTPLRGENLRLALHARFPHSTVDAIKDLIQDAANAREATRRMPKTEKGFARQLTLAPRNPYQSRKFKYTVRVQVAGWVHSDAKEWYHWIDSPTQLTDSEIAARVKAYFSQPPSRPREYWRGRHWQPPDTIEYAVTSLTQR